MSKFEYNKKMLQNPSDDASLSWECHGSSSWFLTLDLFYTQEYMAFCKWSENEQSWLTSIFDGNTYYFKELEKAFEFCEKKLDFLDSLWYN